MLSPQDLSSVVHHGTALSAHDARVHVARRSRLGRTRETGDAPGGALKIGSHQRARARYRRAFVEPSLWVSMFSNQPHLPSDVSPRASVIRP